MIDASPSTLALRLAVYLVADPDQARRDLVDVVDQALRGGVTAVQLRAKRLTDRQAVELGAALADRCRACGALFIVNDRLDIAFALGADGVHLGVDDLPVATARRLVGSDFVVGYSPETDDQAAAAASQGASYLGVGPVFATASKLDAGEPIGLETLARRAGLAGIPVVGIGGVDAHNADQVITAGAAGVAVLGAILGAGEPMAAAQGLAASVHAALERRDMSR